MKKTVAILSILALSQCAFAYIKEGTTSDVDKLQNKGFSQTTLKIIDGERARQARDGEHYVRYYEHDYYKKSSLYQKIKVYLDPIQDDGLFGERENSFSNRFFVEHPTKEEKRNMGVMENL